VSVLNIEGITKNYDEADHPAVADLSLKVETGEIVGVVGESGCGKTTLLRLVAGFEIPDSGTIVIGDAIVTDDKTYLPPEKRGVSMVFQEHALFPHLTVSENVGFGLHKLSRKDSDAQIEEMLALVKLETYKDRYPHELSGGQRQRVALARALAPQPAVLLLDEPFSSLDERLKLDMRDEVREIIHRLGTTTLWVTHEMEYALALSDRMAILRDGNLQQIETPGFIYTHPANEYVANLFGHTNVLHGTANSHGIKTCAGLIHTDGKYEEGDDLTLSIRPEFLEITEDEEGVACNIVRISYCGRYQELILQMEDSCIPPCQITLHAEPGRHFSEDEKIRVRFPQDKVHVITS
jgi:iron(III) transport system ATP-binding protein